MTSLPQRGNPCSGARSSSRCRRRESWVGAALRAAAFLFTLSQLTVNSLSLSRSLIALFVVLSSSSSLASALFLLGALASPIPTASYRCRRGASGPIVAGTAGRSAVGALPPKRVDGVCACSRGGVCTSVSPSCVFRTFFFRVADDGCRVVSSRAVMRPDDH